MGKVQVNIKNVYGKELIYPANKLANGFADLVGQITLTRKDIETIKEMGFEVEVITTPVKL